MRVFYLDGRQIGDYRNLYDYSVLDRYDQGRRLCRSCGALLPPNTKRWWCDDDCKEETNYRYLWAWVRYKIYMRDKRCLYPGCGKELEHMENCNVHHIISIEELVRIIGKNFRGSSLEFYFAVLEAGNDPMNLVTLCWACHGKKVKHFRSSRQKKSWLGRDSALHPANMRFSYYAREDNRILELTRLGLKFIYLPVQKMLEVYL